MLPQQITVAVMVVVILCTFATGVAWAVDPPRRSAEQWHDAAVTAVFVCTAVCVGYLLLFVRFLQVWNALRPFQDEARRRLRGVVVTYREWVDEENNPTGDPTAGPAEPCVACDVPVEAGVYMDAVVVGRPVAGRLCGDCYDRARREPHAFFADLKNDLRGREGDDVG